ncbi:MAG: MFS transporter [Candidatus Riflebacteria bacterium]|nr:MFS transporter [Candidatus Riflebacteria bacterium]
MASPETAAPRASPRAFGRAFAAFQHRTFLIFWLGQLGSLIGSWMQITALSWLVYRLTHSAWVLGTVALAGNLPVLLLGYLAGSLVDRGDRLRLILWAQAAEMVLAFVTAGLTYCGAIQVWHIMVLSVLAGVLHAVEVPARQTFFMDLVGREHLMSAIALNSVAFNLARVIGPTIAGLLLFWITEAGCFLLNGLSFLAVIGSLLAIASRVRTTRSEPAARGGPWDGLRHIFRHPEMRSLLIMVATANLLCTPFFTHLLPVYVGKVLGEGADTLGLFTASFGLGALLGGLATASRDPGTLSAILAVQGFAAMSLTVSCLAFFPGYYSGMVLLVFTGVAMLTQMATTNNYLQTRAPDDLRGRIVAAYTTTFIGLMPFGSLFMGWIADRIGVRSAIMLGSLICFASAVAHYWRLIRPPRPGTSPGPSRAP